MEKKIFTHDFCPTMGYNGGQAAEQKARFELTGLRMSADNIPAMQSADCMGIQFKSYHATLAKCSTIAAYAEMLEFDAADAFAYIPKAADCMYIMRPAEWFEFVTLFHYFSIASNKNGGGAVMRLKRCEQAMVEWLEEMCRG